MRIVQLAPLVSPIVDAPIGLSGDQIGGTQTYLADLAGRLARRGHAVTLLAAPGSRVPGVEVVELPIGHLGLTPASFDAGAERGDTAAQDEAFAIARAWLDAEANRVDVVHAHAFDAPAFDRLRGYRRAVVHTLHLPPLDAGVVAAARAAAGDALLSANSEPNAAAWRAAGVPVREVVPYGLDLAEVPFGARGLGYLLFVGRITPEKGPDLAIEAAARIGRPLVLVGGVYDRRFHAARIAPRVVERADWRPGDALEAPATYAGPRPRAEVFAAMAAADGLLAPARWEEALGLTAIEAPAAGCPVVAFARGGLAEVVADGETGFAVPPDDLDAFVAALGRLGEVERAGCRASIARRFGFEAMLAGYETLYRRAMAR